MKVKNKADFYAWAFILGGIFIAVIGARVSEGNWNVGLGVLGLIAMALSIYFVAVVFYATQNAFYRWKNSGRKSKNQKSSDYLIPPPKHD